MISASNAGTRLQRVHQSKKARTVRELGTADPVVGKNELLTESPALLLGISTRVLELSSD
jgi:hypothetical protein